MTYLKYFSAFFLDIINF